MNFTIFAVLGTLIGTLAAPVNATTNLCSNRTPEEVFLQFLGTKPKFETSYENRAIGEAQRLELIARQLGYADARGTWRNSNIFQTSQSWLVCVSFYEDKPKIDDTSLRGLLVRLNKLSHEIRMVAQAIFSRVGNDGVIVERVKEILNSLAMPQGAR